MNKADLISAVAAGAKPMQRKLLKEWFQQFQTL